ncbi:MAG: cysteine--tRNA ligase [Clostridia bacterium]
MLSLYNSLSRQKEEVSSDNGVVKMYSCGPTVYYFPHIGNMRAYLFMDQIRRTIKFNGLKVLGVINITDVGHLTSDADLGDDKMLVASKRENKTPWEIAKFYQEKFEEDIHKLNIDMPSIVAKATDHIAEMIEFVEVLLKKGHAYETKDGIYFSVESFPEYGALSRISLEDKQAGARIEVDEEKRHPADFALWIKAPKEHIMQWQSPWGMGYPGWHIECSAMGKKYLGDHINVHTGGIDHLPVHHENEIAQNNCYWGKQVVSLWGHVAFLQIDGGKMSKSLGNLFTLDDLDKKGYSPLDFRFFNFSASYRKPINFTWDSLTAAKVSLAKLKASTMLHKGQPNKVSKEKLEKFEKDFLNAINDDLNFPLALGIVWEIVKSEPSNDIFELLVKLDRVLGLDLGKEEKIVLPKEVEELVCEREQARKNKDYRKSDELRDSIASLGFAVKDTKDGQIISKN